MSGLSPPTKRDMLQLSSFLLVVSAKQGILSPPPIWYPKAQYGGGGCFFRAIKFEIKFELFLSGCTLMTKERSTPAYYVLCCT